MDDAVKADLIQQLAGQYGLEGRKKTEDNHYDSSTGTLFVGSKVYQYNDLQRAKHFHEENAVRTKAIGDASFDYYTIAEIAISQLIEQSMSSGGRLVVKDE